MRYSQHYIEYCNRNNTIVNNNFVSWVDRIEELVQKKYTFGLLDIPDEDYMIFYEDGFSPDEVFDEIQKLIGFIY
jgi:hypothetical protein